MDTIITYMNSEQMCKQSILSGHCTFAFWVWTAEPYTIMNILDMGSPLPICFKILFTIGTVEQSCIGLWSKLTYMSFHMHFHIANLSVGEITPIIRAEQDFLLVCATFDIRDLVHFILLWLYVYFTALSRYGRFDTDEVESLID